MATKQIGDVILDVKNISLGFGGVKALTDISFNVREHEVRAIIGPNKKPQTVELVIPTQTSVEVYVGPENRREGATKIGEKEMAQGR